MLIFTFITKHQNSQCNNIICLPTHALYYTFATCNSTISLVVILHVYTAYWVIWPTTIMYQSRPYIFVMQYDSQVYSFIHQLNSITLLPIWIKSYLSLTPIYWYVSWVEDLRTNLSGMMKNRLKFPQNNIAQLPKRKWLLTSHFSNK